jgi:hypothetical protein
VLEGYGVVVFGSDTDAVVLHFDGIQAMVLEADLCRCLLVAMHHGTGGAGQGQTNGGSAGIDTVLYKLFAHRLEVDDNLPRLNVVDRTAFNGLDSGHVNPCLRARASGCG